MGFYHIFYFPLGLLLWSILQTASAPATPDPVICSNQEKQVMFSHTYKIDVPKSSLIQVEADPEPLRDEGGTLLLPGEAGEDQNIIFRHNIRLQTPKRDCELSGSLQDLLARVKKLEEEMAEMKEKCGTQQCCQGAPGECIGHGVFTQDICGCRCDEGWEGPDCSRPSCPGGCSGHGRCVDGRCVCDEPYIGEDCGYLPCPENCSGNGICVRGVCHCHEDFTLEDCSEKRCPNDCSGHGFCDTGECYCEEGFTGLDCSQVPTPQSLQLLKSTEDSLLVHWDPEVDVDHYLLSYYPLGVDTSMKQVKVPKDQLSYDIHNLQPSTKYIINLRNVKKGISSNPQHLLASTDVPVNGTAWVTDETEYSLDVEWENPPVEVDYYKLRYGTLEGQEVKEVTVPKSNDPKSRYDITGLQPGTDYKITVIPMRGGLEGKPISLSGKTGIDSPTNVVTDRVTEDTATVSWDPVQAVIDRYVVRYTSTEGDVKMTPVGKDKSSTVLTGLNPGMEYTVHVWAEKGSQESKKANTKALTEIDSPTNLVTDRVTEDTATISWDPVQADIDRYLVSYTSADGETMEIPVGKEKTSTILTGLRPGMDYTVYVWAEKGNQESKKKANTKAPTEIDDPKNLITDRVTEDTATISWDPVQAVIDRYMVRYTSADGQTMEIPVGKDKTTTILTGLRPGMDYAVHVWAVKGDRESKKANTKAPTEIDSPRNLVTNQVTEDTATISWDPVQAVIDRYMVRYTSADGETKQIPVRKDKTTTILPGLRPGMEHTVYVWAVKKDRESKKANTKALTDIDPPRNLRASDVTQSSGVVTWMPPSAQIDGYILTYQAPDGTSKEVKLGPGDRRFKLQGLGLGVRYAVSLVAFKGGRRSRIVSTNLSTVEARFPHPNDCSQVQQNGDFGSGMYTIYLHGDVNQPMQVYCDMDTDGGGWIVFQRRNTGQLDFFKRWKHYVEGFGDPMREFWFGLEKLHNLTTGTPVPYEVRIDLQTANESAYAVYDFFQVASSKDRYKLTVGKYRGTAGDALSYHNGWKFTTFDRDNDIALSNCALTHHGGWWYKNCHLANPNGRYGETKHSEGVNWEPWKGHEFSIPYVELKIRPHGFSGRHVPGRKKRMLAGKRIINTRSN
uniref:Tenascin-N n=1 Tax=Vombatus ursinus TaxID=29139 RepID=A0A4X2K872_VOMUR